MSIIDYRLHRRLPNGMASLPLPQLSDDAGTPFAVVVIPVDPALAVGVNGGKP